MKCSITILNYDTFATWFNCAGPANASSDSSIAACNTTKYNGSTYYYQYVNYPPYGDMNTDGLLHDFNVSTSGWTNQDYGINSWCYDIDWNWIQTKVAFTINLTAVVTPITVNLSTPTNNTIKNTSTITFEYNVSGPSGEVVNCNTYVNVSNTWANNSTNTFTLTNLTITNSTSIAGFNNGTYIWNTNCVQNTNTSNFGWASANWTIGVSINSTATANSSLNVTLISPANAATVNISSVNYTYNFTGAAQANCSLYTNTTGTWHKNTTTNSLTINGSFNDSSISTGFYLWNVNCVNATDASVSGWASANWTFDFVDNTTATTLILAGVNLSSPDGTQENSTEITFIYNVSGPTTMSCSLWNNNTGAWASRSTK